MRLYDVLVIGGGIIGNSIAFRLAQEKLSVAVIEQHCPGREASWAAAGILSPAPETPADIPLVPFGRASLNLYPYFLAQVETASGLLVPTRRQGTIHVLFSPNAEDEMSTLLALHRELGLPTEPLPLDEARKLEPALGPGARAVALLPYESSVDSRALTTAVATAAANAGVATFSDTRATEIIRDGERCIGVNTTGDRYLADHVVLAAGAFSGLVAGIRPPVATHPIRGQMVALHNHAFNIRHVLRSHSGYIVPRDEATPQLLVIGSTLEDAGFDKRVTPRGLKQILDTIQELAPALTDAKITETWSGLRPGTPDHLPLLGPSTLQGLTIATGHYRNGILLCPITMKLVCEWIIERRVSMDWGIFTPLRFGVKPGECGEAH